MVNELMRLIAEHDSEVGAAVNAEFARQRRNLELIASENIVSEADVYKRQDWYFEDATVEAAAELTRYLMNKYGVPASHVIRHYDVTGKICPCLLYTSRCV